MARYSASTNGGSTTKRGAGRGTDVGVLAGPEPGSVEEQRNRLSRLAGQIAGISRMLEEKRAPSDILIQFKAVRSALDAIEERVVHHALRDGIERALSEDNRTSVKGQLEELFELRLRR